VQLSNLQQAFVSGLTAAPSKELLNTIEDGAIPALERLEVYQNNLFVSLTDILKDTYPTVLAVVGDDFFTALARSFIKDNPPTQGNMTYYGGEFARFIRAFPHTQSLPYLGDVAELDWLVNLSFHAKDDARLTPEDLADKSPDELMEMTFPLRKSVFLIQSDFPLQQIRKMTERKNQQDLDLNQGRKMYVVFRPQLTIKIEEVNADSFLFIDNLDTLPFEQAGTHVPTAEIADLFAQFLNWGLFKKNQL